ncbi:hypothetical protein BS78_03G141500 [Paspalum vaginatum]|nr:hypothetical protein BS78_03G141500 [Paspalum vaginatum]
MCEGSPSSVPEAGEGGDGGGSGGTPARGEDRAGVAPAARPSAGRCKTQSPVDPQSAAYTVLVLSFPRPPARLAPERRRRELAPPARRRTRRRLHGPAATPATAENSTRPPLLVRHRGARDSAPRPAADTRHPRSPSPPRPPLSLSPTLPRRPSLPPPSLPDRYGWKRGRLLGAGRGRSRGTGAALPRYRAERLLVGPRVASRQALQAATPTRCVAPVRRPRAVPCAAELDRRAPCAAELGTRRPSRRAGGLRRPRACRRLGPRLAGTPP